MYWVSRMVVFGSCPRLYFTYLIWDGRCTEVVTYAIMCFTRSRPGPVGQGSQNVRTKSPMTKIKAPDEHLLAGLPMS